MANEYEEALSGLGFNLSDNPEELDSKTEEVSETVSEEVTEETVEAVAEEAPEVETEQPEVLSQETPAEETTTVENVVEEPAEEIVNEISEEERTASVLSAVSEMLGSEFNSIEDLQGLLHKEEQTASESLDPAVQAIADFVSETGRSVNDWFAYQASNPSEMDDSAVMLAKLQQDHNDLSDEDAQLLLDTRYKLDEDMYSENELRVGKLNLKMDAEKARKDLEDVRAQFAAPVKQEAPAEANEVESPITKEWVSAMSDTVDQIESLDIDLGHDKTFSFGLEDSYKQTLKAKNEKLDEFFDQYIDGSGNWDFDSLSAHRAIIDNIDSIAKSIYAQGMSDGQSKIVKEAVNPSSVSPKGASVDAASAQDKVRQQVLDAMRGGDDTMRIKF